MRDIRQVTLKDSHVSYTIYRNDMAAYCETPLLMLHGSKGDGKSSYRRVKKYFRQPQNILLADYAGAGDSSLPATANVVTLASQVVAIIDDFSAGPVDLVGHSLGAVTAAVTAALYPEKIRRLALSAPWCNSKKNHLQLVFRTWEKLVELDTESANAFGLLNFFTPKFLSTINPETMQQLLSEPIPPSFSQRIDINKEVDLTEYLSKIKADTLVIGIRGDTLIPTYMVQEVAEKISNSLYKEIDGGHAIQVENPVDWCQELSSFLYPNN